MQNYAIISGADFSTVHVAEVDQQEVELLSSAGSIGAISPVQFQQAHTYIKYSVPSNEAYEP